MLSVGFVFYLVFLRGVSKIPGEFVLIVSVNKQRLELVISQDVQVKFPPIKLQGSGLNNISSSKALQISLVLSEFCFLDSLNQSLQIISFLCCINRLEMIHIVGSSLKFVTWVRRGVFIF